MDEIDLLKKINLLKSQAIMLLTEEIEDLKSKLDDKVNDEAVAKRRK